MTNRVDQVPGGHSAIPRQNFDIPVLNDDHLDFYGMRHRFIGPPFDRPSLGWGQSYTPVPDGYWRHGDPWTREAREQLATAASAFRGTGPTGVEYTTDQNFFDEVYGNDPAYDRSVGPVRRSETSIPVDSGIWGWFDTQYFAPTGSSHGPNGDPFDPSRGDPFGGGYGNPYDGSFDHSQACPSMCLEADPRGYQVERLRDLNGIQWFDEHPRVTLPRYPQQRELAGGGYILPAIPRQQYHLDCQPRQLGLPVTRAPLRQTRRYHSPHQSIH